MFARDCVISFFLKSYKVSVSINTFINQVCGRNIYYVIKGFGCVNNVNLKTKPSFFHSSFGVACLGQIKPIRTTLASRMAAIGSSFVFFIKNPY